MNLPKDILEQYLTLANQGRFKEGLPLIKEIVQRAPEMPTSWFNLGVCESELGWHSRAAQSFLKAYELDPNDGGALYRACVSLAAAEDHKTLLAVMQQQCQWSPDMIYNFIEDEHLAPLFALPEFQKLKNRYVE